jgi:crotonobetainyl-CoA:carnitine CoA-transferase CaiB-like acyl-CoA transferase
LWCGADLPAGETVATSPLPPRLPFEGVTVIELATFLAAPLGATLLAESGARVIKVEMPEGDQFRRVGLEFVHLAHGKESIAIDLKKSEGQEVLRRLVARADVVLHNMRPGAAERLGASYEDLKAVNPDIVYVYAASYGSKGPQSHRPAFHSTPHALSGGGVLQAGEGNPPVDDSYPDPCAGVAVAAAMALGLLARERTGCGQYIETSMLCSTGYVHSNELVEFEGRAPRATVDAEQRGFHALYRLYQCSSGWLFLGALADREWIALSEAIGYPEWRSDARFATSAARLAHDTALTRELDALFAQRTANEWQATLTKRGVPCAAADQQRFEEFLVTQDFVEPVSHPHYGEYFRIRPRLRFEGVTSRRGQACTKGEHSLAVLEELGFSADQRQQLVESGCVVAG